MLGFLGNSFRICLGPPRGHLWPSLALFGASLGVLGARLELSWARYGPDQAPLGSSLGFLGAMLCHLEVSWELFGRHWSLPGGILGQIGVPRVPRRPSWGHLGAILKPIGGSAIRSIFPMRGSGEI